MENRIKELLAEKSMTALDLSSKTGLSRVSLSNIINNKQEASANTLKVIADGLGVAFWELFESREDIINQDKTHITCPKCGARFRLEE